MAFGEKFDEHAVRSLRRFNKSPDTSFALPTVLESRIMEAEAGMIERFYPDMQ